MNDLNHSTHKAQTEHEPPGVSMWCCRADAANGERMHWHGALLGQWCTHALAWCTARPLVHWSCTSSMMLFQMSFSDAAMGVCACMVMCAVEDL